MQDNEFDDLFRSKLDNFEAEPPAQAWQNIDAELSGRKRKSIFPMLSIAASVLILLIAGVLFTPKKGTVKHNRPDSNKVAIKVKPEVVKPGNSNPLITPEKKQEQVAVVQTPVRHITKADQPKIKVSPVEQKEQTSPAIAKTETVKQDGQPALAATNTMTEDNAKPIELDTAPAVVKHADDNSAISLPAQPMLASTPAVKAAKPVVKKRGIRNFGDLVNLVVAKVDKRKDKLIQFTDSDDDESMISAVHIGVVKIKRDN